MGNWTWLQAPTNLILVEGWKETAILPEGWRAKEVPSQLETEPERNLSVQFEADDQDEWHWASHTPCAGWRARILLKAGETEDT